MELLDQLTEVPEAVQRPGIHHSPSILPVINDALPSLQRLEEGVVDLDGRGQVLYVFTGLTKQPGPCNFSGTHQLRPCTRAKKSVSSSKVRSTVPISRYSVGPGSMFLTPESPCTW